MADEKYPSDSDLSAMLGNEQPTGSGLKIPGWDVQNWGTHIAKWFWRAGQGQRIPTGLEVYKDGDLKFGVRAGRYPNGQAAVNYGGAADQSLTNDATNYIYLTAAGVLTVNTTCFPDWETAPHIRLATIATGTASQAGLTGYYDFVDIVDYRGMSMFRVLGEVAGPGAEVRNATGTNMTAGDLVYISGYNATDDCPEAALADADDPAKRATHVLPADIDDGDTGAAAEWAVVLAITSGLAVGDPVYLSATAGEWTDTAPTGADQVVQVVGIVKTVGASGTVVFMPGMGMVQAAGTSFLQDQAVTQDKLNDAQAEHVAVIRVEDLAAGEDISPPRPAFVHPRAVTLVSAGILTEGAPAGIDDSNTAVVALYDDTGSNVIVSKIYMTGTQPPTGDYEDLGALDPTHKVLAAGEHVELLVNQGPTADMPAFSLILRYTVADG